MMDNYRGESGTLAIEQGADLLGPYLDATRGLVISVLIYFNVHLYVAKMALSG